MVSIVLLLSVRPRRDKQGGSRPDRQRTSRSELEDSTCLAVMLYSIALLEIRMIIDTFLLLSIEASLALDRVCDCVLWLVCGVGWRALPIPWAGNFYGPGRLASQLEKKERRMTF